MLQLTLLVHPLFILNPQFDDDTLSLTFLTGLWFEDRPFQKVNGLEFILLALLWIGCYPILVVITVTGCLLTLVFLSVVVLGPFPSGNLGLNEFNTSCKVGMLSPEMVVTILLSRILLPAHQHITWSSFPVPTKVVKICDKLIWDFLREGSHGEVMFIMLIWLPKLMSDLAIDNLRHCNMALLAKWIWHFLHEESAVWQKLVIV